MTDSAVIVHLTLIKACEWLLLWSLICIEGEEFGRWMMKKIKRMKRNRWRREVSLKRRIS